MKKHNLLLIFSLFIFILVRWQLRIINPLWVDETAVIDSLISIRYLLGQYLPHIPGGSPGYYLIVYPLYKLFSANEYILILPGLISQILVFIYIPNIIRRLQVVEEKKISLVSAVTRFLFLIDPTLSFQAVELRPYSMLPFFWMTSVYLVDYLLQLDKQKLKYSSLAIAVLLIFFFLNWHYYLLLMIAGLYMYYLSKLPQKISLPSLIKRKSIRVILLSILLSLPLWLYFSSGSYMFNFNAFNFIPVTIMQIAAIHKGFPQGLIWQNTLYFCLLVLMLVLCFLAIISKITGKKSLFSNNTIQQFFRINILLVLMPLGVIFFLDYIQHYYFLLRQFSWIFLPFYISIGVAVSDVNFRNHLTRKTKELE